MSKLDFDPEKTAMLVMDCQKGIVNFVPSSSSIFKKVPGVLETARRAGIRVIHVGLGFRNGYPEVSAHHPSFSGMRQTGLFVDGTESAEFHEGAMPKPGEITIVKHRVSAFSGNDLEMILRSQEITTVILLGIATSGIVLSTLRQASDLDFKCFVIEDCCADSDEEVHRVLTGKVFARQATVVSADQFTKECP